MSTMRKNGDGVVANYICVVIEVRKVRVTALSSEEAEDLARMSSFAMTFDSDLRTEREWTFAKCIKVTG